MAEISKSKLTITSIVSFTLIVALLGWFWVSHSGLQQAPDVALQFIDGRKSELYKLTTGPLLVTFWATTCETCIKKTPELKALYKKLNPRGLELVAVAMAYDPPNRILAFAEDNDIAYPIALDLDGSVAKAFDDVALTPTTFLISADMKIVTTTIGTLNMDELEKEIVNLLEKPSSVALNETS
ncbi:MAG: TlpA family protein disulfide reductase [Gammaproteobacteria bacterium]|jgi:peroxiredoxin|nr:TlpA family protein disulfide reductase [Gammaproteobacteria bacterium]